MNLKKIEEGVRLILEGIGEDVTREGIQDTPHRVAEMCAEIFSGLDQEPRPEVGFLENTAADDVISIKNISFFSMCEHHLLPFFGTVDIYYVPRNNRVAGFSSIAKIVDIFSRRPQIQERLTNQIADAVMEIIKPRGVLVVATATQLCLSMRGARKEAAQTVTRALRGSIPEDKLRFSIE